MGIGHFWIFTLLHRFLLRCTFFLLIPTTSTFFSTLISPPHGDPEKAVVMSPIGPIVGFQPSDAVEETRPIIVKFPVLLRIRG